MKLLVKNKLVSVGGGSTVLSEDGKEVFTIKGKVFSLSNRKSVYSQDGTLLYVVKNVLFAGLTYSCDVFDGAGEKLFRIKENVALLEKFSSDNGADGLRMEREGAIIKMFKNDVQFASMKREYFKLGDTFEVDITSEEDASLAVAMVIAYDNITDRKQKNRK